ncbi:MAG TPA: hypothetical protein VFE24_15335 [Pirellulales bacterium]|jgi:hypothetical protein|nr:hypothetical protein [Pirellulales bacterium]
MPFDPAADFTLIADLLQSVTLRRADTGALSLVNHGLRRTITTGEAEASGGKYTRADAVWHLPSSELAAPPRVGDALIDAADVVWTILEIQAACGGARWRCLTRNLALTAGLADTITIQQATWSKSAAGAASAVWTDLHIGLAASIQLQRAEVQEDQLDRSLRSTHRIVIAMAVAVDENCRILDADGNLYHVVGYEQAARIDALPVILATQSPWPLA